MMGWLRLRAELASGGNGSAGCASEDPPWCPVWLGTACVAAVLALVASGCCGSATVEYETSATYTPASGGFARIAFDADGERPRAWDIGERGEVELRLVDAAGRGHTLAIDVDAGLHTLAKDAPALGALAGATVDGRLLEAWLVQAGAPANTVTTAEAAEIDGLLDDAVVGPKGVMPASTAHLTRTAYTSVYR